MKNSLLPFLIALIIVGGITFVSSNKQSPPLTSLDSRVQDSELFSKEGMENAKARAEWDRQRQMDPLTGEIPPNMRAKELAFAATLPKDYTNKADSLTVPWTQRGPWNLGGRTRAFAMDVLNNDIMLAGGVSGGIWRSTDAGTSWARVTEPGAHPGVNDIDQDTRPGHESTWYALAGEAYGTSASGGGAFYLGNGMTVSTDNGLTWTSIPTTVNGSPQSFNSTWEATWNVALDASDAINDVIYAAHIGTVLRSSNAGTSWTRVLGSGTTNLSYFTNVMVTPGGNAYATLSSEGTDPGMWRSADGVNWADISPPFLPGEWGRTVTAYNPLNEDRIYFLVAGVDSLSGKRTTDFRGEPEWNALWRYTYLSGDGTGAGGIWEDLSVNIPATGGPFDKFVVQGGYNLLVGVHPVDTNLVIIGGTNLYRSTTAFNDSTNSTHIGGYGVGAGTPDLFLGLYPNTHPDHHVLFFDPANPDVVFNGNDGGLFRTDDVTAPTVGWTSLNNGYLVSQFYTVALDHGTVGSDVICGGLQDNGTYHINSSTPTDPWAWVSGGDGAYIGIEDGGTTFYFSKQLGRIAKVELDAAGNVQQFERIDPIGADDYRFINPFVLDPNDQNVMYLPEGPHIWRNSDLSQIPYTNTWDSITTNWTKLADSIPGGADITSIGVTTSNPANRLYVGTNAKFIFRYDDANTATPTRVNITNNLVPAGANLSCMAVHPDNGDEVVAVISNYNTYSIWRSTNAGSNWEKIAGNLEQFSSGNGNGPSVRWVKILPFSTRDVYLAATSTGLYGTDSLNGQNTVWTQLGANSIGNSVVDMIDFRRSDGRTVIGTHGYGIWSATMTPPAVSLEQPLQTGVEVQVYPNPVTANSKLSITLDRADQVMIEVFDVQGRKVESLPERYMGIGQQEIPLSIHQIQSGAYQVIVTGSDWKQVVKVIVP